jgi:hypothetical protein
MCYIFATLYCRILDAAQGLKSMHAASLIKSRRGRLENIRTIYFLLQVYFVTRTQELSSVAKLMGKIV